MKLRILLGSVVIWLAVGSVAHADRCDALTARIIRGTGASLASRAGRLVVFRAADAERMSLDCAEPHRMVFRSADREPSRFYFALIGLAARTLAGARADRVEVLAMSLHQAALLTGEPRAGRVGRVVVSCDPVDDVLDASGGALCHIASALARRSRSRAGLLSPRAPG